jgi:single-stranded DNA-binding protein
MSDTNYIGSVVKILEIPKQKFLANNNAVTEFRVELPQVRNTTIVHLVFWGNLARDVATYYKINDYILIEGYLSLRDKPTVDLIAQPSKKIKVTVLKVYPFLLSYDPSAAKS